MSNSFGAGQYKQMQVKTANRGQVLIMLYESAIQNVKKATLAIDKKDLAAKGVAIIKTHDIINELLNTLDFEVGGQIARDLERLYNFVTEQLLKANIENSKEALQAVEKTLSTLLEGWKIAVQEVNRNNAATGNGSELK